MPLGEPSAELQVKVQNLAELQAETFEFLDPEPTATNTKGNDPINSPSHYTWLKDEIGVEPIDICEKFNFNIGSALKYLMRAGRKRENENFALAQNAYVDLMKAAVFCKKREAMNQFAKSSKLSVTKWYIVKYLNKGHLLSDGSHTAEFSYEDIARKRFMEELKTKSNDKLLLLECDSDNMFIKTIDCGKHL